MSNNDLKKLQNYRKEMKALDAELFSLLKKRIQLSQKIMKFKKQKDLPLKDTNREAEIEKQLSKTLKAATTQVRAKKFVRALLELNAKYPRSLERKI